MKKIALLLLIALPFISKAQDEKEKEDSLIAMFLPKDSNGTIKLFKVITVNNANANAIYSKAKLFIAETFVSTKDVMQLNDDASFTIVAKPAITTKTRWLVEYNGFVDYTLKIECKDNKYRYTITDFTFSYIDRFGKKITSPLEANRPTIYTKGMWRDVMLQTASGIQLLTSSLQKKLVANTTDNW